MRNWKCVSILNFDFSSKRLLCHVDLTRRMHHPTWSHRSEISEYNYKSVDLTQFVQMMNAILLCDRFTIVENEWNDSFFFNQPLPIQIDVTKSKDHAIRTIHFPTIIPLKIEAIWQYLLYSSVFMEKWHECANSKSHTYMFFMC